MHYLLGLDNGGTMTKAALFDENGTPVASASRQTPLSPPSAGREERDMEELWQANAACIREVLERSGIDPGAVAGVGCTGHGKGAYLWGEDGPVCPAIASTDRRAEDIVRRLAADGTAAEVRRRTLQPPIACQPPLLLRWIKRRFAADGHDIDAATADHLLFTCGSLMTDLLPEIGKVSAFAKGQSVTIADINAVVEPRLEARVFDMTRAITAGSYNEAAHILGELLRQRTEPIMILAAVGKELRQLYTARMALDAGKDRFWLKQVWGMNSDYPAKLLLQAARRVDHRWCQDAVQACQVLDRRMKSEKNIESEDELKLFLMGLAARR